ncbi:MAG TPA: nicotinate-nucleotide--dimethylbenzimidazole phosphoribosyltransferase [Actinomycetota bacterium]|nr:nicotinate-nucleotide--dimethylbenzimidazole phosphoribosyltransferase [Actinomycetota bacterium]
MISDWWREVGDTPEPSSPVLLIVVADDPGAVSTLPADFGQQWLAATLDGATPTARLADRLRVQIHHAQSPEIPDGHDLLLLADAGRGLTTLAAQIACTELPAEPQLVTGFGSGISDVQWMSKVGSVRDRARDAESPPAPLGLLAAILEQAADRGLPTLMDGAVSAAAAVLADRLPPLQVPAVGREPAQHQLLDRLNLGGWGGMGIDPGLGLGSLSGLAMLQVALLVADV